MALRRIKALVLLGIQFIAHLVTRVFGSHRGLDEFKAQYSEDHVFPFNPALRDQWHNFEKCLVCRLCDGACPSVKSRPFHEFPGPSYLLSAMSRGLNGLKHVGASSADCAPCASHACEPACPERIPIAALMGLMRQTLGEKHAY